VSLEKAIAEGASSVALLLMTPTIKGTESLEKEAVEISNGIVNEVGEVCRNGTVPDVRFSMVLGRKAL
jgi:hypothetical protein